MTQVRECFTPHLMEEDTEFETNSGWFGGFIACTNGSITITAKSPRDGSEVTLVDAFPLIAGTYAILPLRWETPTIKVTLAEGARGTALV